MPEGDTIAHAAVRLKKALEGGELRSVYGTISRSPSAIVGESISAVQTAGKYLFIAFNNGYVLKTHLGLHGRWSVRARAPRSLAGKAIVLEAENAVAVCERARTIEWVRGGQTAIRAESSHLGPDILSPDWDALGASARVRDLFPDLPIATVLLDQSAIAGIGNIYKNEILFQTHVHPNTRVRELRDDQVLQIFRTARVLMMRNAKTLGPRRTRMGAGSRFWVYQRAGLPCFRCGARIELLPAAQQNRSTYVCPNCQQIA